MILAWTLRCTTRRMYGVTGRASGMRRPFVLTLPHRGSNPHLHLSRVDAVAEGLGQGQVSQTLRGGSSGGREVRKA